MRCSKFNDTHTRNAHQVITKSDRRTKLCIAVYFFRAAQCLRCTSAIRFLASALNVRRALSWMRVMWQLLQGYRLRVHGQELRATRKGERLLLSRPHQERICGIPPHFSLTTLQSGCETYAVPPLDYASPPACASPGRLTLISSAAWRRAPVSLLTLDRQARLFRAVPHTLGSHECGMETRLRERPSRAESVPGPMYQGGSAQAQMELRPIRYCTRAGR